MLPTGLDTRDHLFVCGRRHPTSGFLAARARLEIGRHNWLPDLNGDLYERLLQSNPEQMSIVDDKRHRHNRHVKSLREVEHSLVEVIGTLIVVVQLALGKEMDASAAAQRPLDCRDNPLDTRSVRQRERAQKPDEAPDEGTVKRLGHRREIGTPRED